jgi:riboflavin biosynthesis pyrimidine reductase
MDHMQLLLPRGTRPDGPDDASDTATGVDLHAHYGRDWLEHGGVRVNFIASVDGRATVAGRSRGLQTPGDNKVFAALRDLADVVLVGASTAAAEDYRPAHPAAERQTIRQERGLSAAPAVAIASSTLDLDLSRPIFADDSALAPTLIITGSAAPVTRRNDIIDATGSNRSLQLVEVPSRADGALDFAAAVGQLRAMGYRRILCEGGPRLFASAVLARAVDDLCITLAPMLVGPAGPAILSGPEWQADLLPQLRLTGLLVEDDALFCRYQLRH